MISTDDALLAAILANPEDDLPRLVYADWLEEAGFSERAEFIRIQCHLRDASSTDLGQLQFREKLLLDRYGKSWLAPLRAKGEALQNSGTHGLFRRGFVEIVWMPAAIFCWKAVKLFRKAPVNELRITRLSLVELHNLLEIPELLHLHTLDLSSHRLGSDGLRKLFRCTNLLNLKRLRLRRCFLDNADLDTLLDQSNQLQALQELDLGHNPIDDRTVERLRRRFGPSLQIITTTTEY